MPMRVGDVVRLKSGGPLMTIDHISEDGQDAQCVWFGTSIPATAMTVGTVWSGGIQTAEVAMACLIKEPK